MTPILQSRIRATNNCCTDAKHVDDRDDRCKERICSLAKALDSYVVDKFIITEENDNMLVTQLTNIAIYVFSTVANRIEVKTKA